MGPDVRVYRLYFRFLETDDEYFNYDPQDRLRRGAGVLWLALPDDVLEKYIFEMRNGLSWENASCFEKEEKGQ